MEEKKISRQRAWQLAKLEEGLCTICGDQPIGTTQTMCEECAERDRANRAKLRAERKAEKEKAK